MKFLSHGNESLFHNVTYFDVVQVLSDFVNKKRLLPCERILTGIRQSDF